MLYLRKEKETKEEMPFIFKPRKLTRAYSDREATKHVATWPVGIAQPHKNSKTVVLNCSCHDVTWLPDKFN
jgi:hypothetical protein